MSMRSSRWNLPVLLAALVLSCSAVRTQTGRLTILHTNDMHSGVVPHEAYWVRSDPKPMVGGFRELQFTIDSIRRANPNVVVLDAGDVMTGTPMAEIVYDGAVGGALFRMMNMIGYDAWTIGNHDLDISQDNLSMLTAMASFPTLSANLTDSAGRFPFHNRPCIVIERGGLKIGIIGIMSADLFRLTNTNNLRGIAVGSPAAVTQHLIDSLKPMTDVIIALTHEGVDEDSVLAANTRGLSAIIGGHSHTRLRSPKLVNSVVICQAGNNCENLGELDMVFDHGAVTSYNGKLIQLWPHADRPETPLSKFIDSLRTGVDREYGEVVGTLSSDWETSRAGESGLGNFIADAIREGAGADIGLTNSSGIRKQLHAGNITRLDLFEITPFRNYLCTFSYTGKELRGLVQWYLTSVMTGRTSIDLSGIRCTWKRSVTGPDIESLTVNGRAVTDDGTYTMATTDFLLSQGTKYITTLPPAVQTTQTTINQALERKVRKEKTVSGGLEHHFTELH